MTVAAEPAVRDANLAAGDSLLDSPSSLSPSGALAFIAGYLEESINPKARDRHGRFLRRHEIEKLIARANKALASYQVYEVLK